MQNMTRVMRDLKAEGFEQDSEVGWRHTEQRISIGLAPMW